MSAKLIGLAVGVFALTVAEAQFVAPVPGPDASDLWMRQQIMNLGQGLQQPAPAPAQGQPVQSVQSGPQLDDSDKLMRQQIGELGNDLHKIMTGTYTKEDVAKWRVQAKIASAISSRMQSSIETERQKGQRLAKDAIRRADREFLKDTGNEFKNTLRPTEAGRAQQIWDYCNAVHQIWE